MATSGITAWSLTARDHVMAALQESNVIASGEEPTADEMSDCLLRFNGMLKSWALLGAGLWLNGSDTVTITGGVASVTLDAGIREVTDARLVESSTYERQLGQWNRADYQALPNKAAAGNPTVFYTDRQRAATVLYVWPVPATDKTLAIDYDRIIETITDASQTLDVPDELQETIYLNLAMRCAGLFNAELKAELVARAGRLESAMLDSGRPASYYMGAAYA